MKNNSLYQQILDTIKQYKLCYGNSPSLKDIGDILHKDKMLISRAFRHLQSLGYIHKYANAHRAYRVINYDYDKEYDK